MQEFLKIIFFKFNFFVKFGCMSIIINYVYIHCHFLRWLILPCSFFILCLSSNVLLFLIHDTSLFQILFYYRRNKMKNLGYHFCQISQNVMPVLKPIVSFTSINLCIFTVVVFSPNVIFKDSKHIILLIQKCISVEKTFLSYKIYFFMHHSFKVPCP
jgi:hypothetical protein